MRMLDSSIIRRYAFDPQGLAAYYSAEYFKKHEMAYPINPFQLLRDAGVHFVFRDYGELEGTFFPATSVNDIDLVSINARRPIARQRYTAAHELCHFLKDAKPSACETNSKDDIERYAEQFAAALLMPQDELKLQITAHLTGRFLDNDDILLIAEYFGASFMACTYRISNLFPDVLREKPTQKFFRQYRPMIRRRELGLDDTKLFSDLFDVWDDITYEFNEGFAQRVFENEYVYNDTRLEGIEVDAEAAAEIVTDLRMHTQHSRFCSEAYQNYCHVAGHATMYQKAFTQAHDPQLTIYQLLLLHQQLYSCFPEPSYGGKLRHENTLVLDAKFETLDYTEVPKALADLEMGLQKLEQERDKLSRSEYIRRTAELHHRITVIHPFGDGNGRTSRALLNMMLIRHGLPPIYIKVKQKDDYRASLAAMDRSGDNQELFLLLLNAILRSHVDLSRQG